MSIAKTEFYTFIAVLLSSWRKRRSIVRRHLPWINDSPLPSEQPPRGGVLLD